MFIQNDNHYNHLNCVTDLTKKKKKDIRVPVFAYHARHM